MKQRGLANNTTNNSRRFQRGRFKKILTEEGGNQREARSKAKESTTTRKERLRAGKAKKGLLPSPEKSAKKSQPSQAPKEEAVSIGVPHGKPPKPAPNPDRNASFASCVKAKNPDLNVPKDPADQRNYLRELRGLPPK